MSAELAVGQAAPNRVPDWREIETDAFSHGVRLPVGVHLDFGGIAKGWAAGEAARRLAEYGPALVDAGGDIAVSGPMANGDRWPIGLANPWEPARDLALLMLSMGGVATSGRDYRRWVRAGTQSHHLIDPRTALPARTDVLSATVIASSVVQAEIAAKAALILGSSLGLMRLARQPQAAGLLVLEDGRVLRNQNFDDFVWGETIALQSRESLAWS
jgi:thiamine biosynthesis lipoprotein